MENELLQTLFDSRLSFRCITMIRRSRSSKQSSTEQVVRHINPQHLKEFSKRRQIPLLHEKGHKV